jgi:hypothetical protein
VERIKVGSGAVVVLRALEAGEGDGSTKASLGTWRGSWDYSYTMGSS